MSRADTGTKQTDKTKVEKLQTAAIASIGVAVLGFLTGIATGQLLAGTFVFLAGMWAGIGLGLLKWRSTQGLSIDGSNDIAFQRASYWTIVTVSVATGALFPLAFFLEIALEVSNIPGFQYVVGTVSSFLLLFTILYMAFRSKI